jgi:competence protein ComEC
LSVGIGGLAYATTGLRALHFAQQALPPALEGRDIRVEGRIVDMPQRGEFGPRFLLEVTQADVVGVPSRLLISWYQGPAAPVEGAVSARTSAVLRAGEQWRFVVRLKAPHGLRNPRGFDYELWLWERGIQATGSVRAGVLQPQRLSPAPVLSLQGARQSLRDALFARVRETAPAGVLAGLAVGDQQAITQADWDVFRATGVAHLMSISGLHVTMFAWLAAAVVGAAWRRCASLCLM